MKATIKSKCDQVREGLRSNIIKGMYSGDNRIPTEPELCEEFNVSRITVREAVTSLAHEGILTKVQGKGTFVNEEYPPMTGETLRSVVLLYGAGRELEDSYHFQVFKAVGKYFEGKDIEVKLRFIQGAIDLEQYRGTSGVILSSVLADRNIEEISTLGKPTVLYAKNTDIAGIHVVLPDYADGALKAMEYLVERGYRKFVCVDECLPENDRSKIYIRGYLEGLNKFGLEPEERSIWDFTDLDARILELKKTLNESAGVKTAIMVPNDESALDVVRKLKNVKLSIPDQVGVIGFYDRIVGRYSEPRLTSIGFDKMDFGWTIADKLWSLMNKIDVEQKTLFPVELRERDST